MIRNNLFSKKNLQEILQICIIIILDRKKFFDSTLIFIILFARNSLNFHSSKNINSKHQSFIYFYFNNFYLLSS